MKVLAGRHDLFQDYVQYFFFTLSQRSNHFLRRSTSLSLTSTVSQAGKVWQVIKCLDIVNYSNILRISVKSGTNSVISDRILSCGNFWGFLQVAVSLNVLGALLTKPSRR